MADLDGRSRGQLILVAAFALAVIFITLALIVNSAIFTQNLASRGETSGADDALSHRAMVEASVGDNVEIANRRNYSSDLEDAIENSIENTTVQGERQQVTSGTLVRISVSDPDPIIDGSRIVQNESGGRTFEDNSLSGNAEWTVLTRVNRVPGHNGTRAFRMNVSKLPSSSDPPFILTANGTGGSGKWVMEVSGDVDSLTSDNEVSIAVDTPSSSDTCTVEVDRSFAVIDVTSGTIDGEPCDALRQGSSDGRFANGVGNEYNVTFERGAEVEGNYSLITSRDKTDIASASSTLNTTSEESPYVTEANYDVTVRYTYETSGLYYETTIRVAPGEPDA